jgi:hypothetical protein
VREGTDVVVLACLSVKRGLLWAQRGKRGRKPRLEKLSAEQGRGYSGCPGALQTNRAPMGPCQCLQWPGALNKAKTSICEGVNIQTDL